MTRVIPYQHNPVTGQEAFRKILESWHGTPYIKGQCLKNVGVDCLRFVSAALDEWRTGVVAPLPRTLSYETPEAFMKSMHTALQHFEPLVPVEDLSLEPGDVILSKNPMLNYHVHVAGTMQGELWHADNQRGVARTGYVFTGPVLRVWRLLGKEAWTRDS